MLLDVRGDMMKLRIKILIVSVIVFPLGWAMASYADAHHWDSPWLTPVMLLVLIGVYDVVVRHHKRRNSPTKIVT